MIHQNFSVFYFLITNKVSSLHASQEARLREFVLSRRSSGNRVTEHEPAFTVSNSLRAEYSGTDQSALKAADKITALPGQPGDDVGFDQYSGYVTVDEKNGRALFYYFVEATHDAAAKPLLLWLNGGPGCSSVGYGAMIELGPFRINSDNKTLSRNENAWNSEANVLFLESPAGVGFSYSNTTSDYNMSGDRRTADDAFVFMINWIQRFPEYKGRAFYISGESYAGHYVPQLATDILSHNINSKNNIINLQAILVGNAYLDYNKNTKGQIDYLWSHGVISDEVWTNITRNCKFSPLDGKACSDAMASYDSGYISGYNIYAPVCINEPNGTYYPSSYVSGIDPCSNYYIQAYFNEPMVQKAFHARMTKWSGCTDLHWKDAPVSMMPTIKWLLDHGLPVWLYRFANYKRCDRQHIFSGDFDATCPLTATRYSITDLELSVMEPWRPWTANKEVGGYVQQYKGGLVLVLVRGAGHQVPYFQPERALVLVSSFLKGTLPSYIMERRSHTHAHSPYRYEHLRKTGLADLEIDEVTTGASLSTETSKKMRTDAYLTHLIFLLLVSVAVLHANASQQAQIEKLISFRRAARTGSSSKASSVPESGVRVRSSLLAGYSGADQSALKAADKIAALPGQPDGVEFDQYGGYVTVDEKNGRALFYYLAEAPQDASSKPLLLWLNGGPGCSSLGYGAMLELGPFRVNNDNRTLRINKYAWNNEANVLFLESPAGVGYSYSNTTSDYDESGDAKTAEDAYIFLSL
ncbi:hypothetical protein U9M48_014642 [Paspalum notatum var. saurae]|uniref:Carboxypeptidase n=1 Tax=Paspalum notatum var. saurae TaxID=547442 RepID=A0AAQ3T1L1_PASNO